MRPSKNDLDYIHQVAADWDVPPFIDIVTTSETVCPESHPDVVFSRPFYGSDTGCDCLGVWPDMKVRDKFGREVVKKNDKSVLTPQVKCGPE